MEMKKAHPKSRIPKFQSDSTGKDFLRFQALYEDRRNTVEILNTAWQQLDCKDVSLRIPNQEIYQGLEGLVDLVLADPFYGPKWQPTLTERPIVRKLFDKISKDRTVFLIFGRPDMLYLHWYPVFEHGLANSTVEYKIESSLFHVVRASSRDKFTHNFSTWHSMCEDALTVIRQPKATKQKKNRTISQDQAETLAIARPTIFHDDDEFANKYGVNGRPSNVFKDYEPPSARMRLRDAEGKELRNNAEKSIVLNEYLVDLFTEEEGVVFDMFAGTGSMGLACVKTLRHYVGCEPDLEVHTWATQRIGRAWAAWDRGELVKEQAGVRRALAEQVHKRQGAREKKKKGKEKEIKKEIERSQRR
jgi:hypothetical protein